MAQRQVGAHGTTTHLLGGKNVTWVLEHLIIYHRHRMCTMFPSHVTLGGVLFTCVPVVSKTRVRLWALAVAATIQWLRVNGLLRSGSACVALVACTLTDLFCFGKSLCMWPSIIPGHVWPLAGDLRLGGGGHYFTVTMQPVQLSTATTSFLFLLPPTVKHGSALAG
jgi:hypothetical protein